VDDVEVLVPTDPEDARQFSQVISGLQKSYPRDKMEEISTSFCFICLLHLANEQGLKLESADESNVFVEKGLVEDEDEEIISSEKKIGNIWDIKVGFSFPGLLLIIKRLCRFIVTLTSHRPPRGVY
jgi:condensin complex subunit 2